MNIALDAYSFKKFDLKKILKNLLGKINTPFDRARPSSALIY